MKVTKKEHAEALETLRRCYPKGSTVYTVLESVSRSGMQARIRLVALLYSSPTRTCVLHPNWAASKVTGYALVRGGCRDSLCVNGCGFDRSRAIVDAIQHTLGYSLMHEEL